jgi:hypothetical protein
MNLAVSKQNLSHAGCILIVGLDEKWTLEPGGGKSDAFLIACAKTSHSRHVFDLGQFPNIERYTLCHRFVPTLDTLCIDPTQENAPLNLLTSSPFGVCQSA